MTLFAAIGIDYLLTSYVKKNFDYIEFTEVPLGKILCRRNKDLVGFLVKKKEVSSIY